MKGGALILAAALALVPMRAEACNYYQPYARIRAAVGRMYRVSLDNTASDHPVAFVIRYQRHDHGVTYIRRTVRDGLQLRVFIHPEAGSTIHVSGRHRALAIKRVAA